MPDGVLIILLALVVAAATMPEKEAEERLKGKGGSTMDKGNIKKHEAKSVVAAAAVAFMAFMAVAAGAAMGALSGCAAHDIIHDQEWRELVMARVEAMTNRLAQVAAGEVCGAASGTNAFLVLPAGGRQDWESADEVDFGALSWSYGGFNGSAALPVDGCMIADLQVSASRITYRWTAGGCEMLGAASATDANCIAALFVRDAAGNWKGGKFDWISTSRTLRGFENITEHGYNGWPRNAINTATAYAFVIVSKGGDRRTNVIVQEGGVR